MPNEHFSVEQPEQPQQPESLERPEQPEQPEEMTLPYLNSVARVSDVKFIEWKVDALRSGMDALTKQVRDLRYMVFLLMSQQGKSDTSDPIHSLRWEENMKSLQEEFVTKKK
jgi:hypothetical protein